MVDGAGPQAGPPMPFSVVSDDAKGVREGEELGIPHSTIQRTCMQEDNGRPMPYGLIEEARAWEVDSSGIHGLQSLRVPGVQRPDREEEKRDPMYQWRHADSRSIEVPPSNAMHFSCRGVRRSRAIRAAKISRAAEPRPRPGQLQVLVMQPITLL